MTADHHQTFVYTGLAGEGEYIGAGGLYRYAAQNGEWQSLTNGLPENPQVRALLMHPHNPAMLYAGTNRGPYRSDDRGEHWEALEAPQQGTDVWSLAFHPNDANIIYAGYEPCAIYRSEDSGEHWKKMNTEKVVFPHITTYMPPLGKRVIGMAADPSAPQDMYAAIEVGGLLASHDGGRAGSRSPTACTFAITPWICMGCRSALRPLAPYTSSPRWPCSGVAIAGGTGSMCRSTRCSRAAHTVVGCWWRRTIPILCIWRPELVVGGLRRAPRRPEPCFAAATSVRRGNVSISATRRPAAWRRSPLTVPILPTSTAAPCTDRYTAAMMAASLGRKASCRQRRCAVGGSMPWRVARGGKRTARRAHPRRGQPARTGATLRKGRPLDGYGSRCNNFSRSANGL